MCLGLNAMLVDKDILVDVGRQNEKKPTRLNTMASTKKKGDEK